MGRRKRIRTLEWLGEENKQKKARRSKSARIIFQWISTSQTIHRYRTQQKSHCKNRCYRCQVPKFLQNLSLLLTRSFCPLDTIAIASSARSIFAFSLRDVFSFVLRCFRFFELVHEVFRGLCLLITNRITPAWINNADQLSRGERLLVTSLFTFVLISIRLDS